MGKPWFDSETGLLLLDEHVADMPSYKKIMADEVVSDDELREHAERTVELMKRLDAALPPDLHDMTTEVLCELAVLYALERKRQRGIG